MAGDRGTGLVGRESGLGRADPWVEAPSYFYGNYWVSLLIWPQLVLICQEASCKGNTS